MIPENNDNPTSPSSPHSRRDFLRRAGRQAVREAVDIGTKVVPGGAIVRQFVEGGRLGDDTVADTVDAPNPRKTDFMNNPLKWFAAWRDGKTETNNR